MSHLHHKISALVDGELDGVERRRALRHVRCCAPCRQELEATVALKRRMAGLSNAQAPADLSALVDSLTARVCEGGPASFGSSLSPGSGRRPVFRRLLVGAGAVTTAVLSLAYALGAPVSNAAPRVSPPIDEYTADFADDPGSTPFSDPAGEILAAAAAAAAAAAPSAEPAATVDTTMSAGASMVSTPQTQAVAEHRAVSVLQRAVWAPDHYAYHGVKNVRTYEEDGTSEVRLTIQHSPQQGTNIDVREGSWSDASTTFVAQQPARGPARGLDTGPLRLLDDAYDLAVVSSARVLGRPATVVRASSDGAVTADFWVDDASGLLLRRDLYEGGQLVRSTRFTQLRLLDDGFLTHLSPALTVPTATPVATTSAAVLHDDGWVCPSTLARGFTLTRLEHLDTAGDVMRASYSDGLSSVSLFQQRGRLDPAALTRFSRTTPAHGELFVRFGVPTVAVSQSGDTVYALVTDAPPAVAKAVIAGLPHDDVVAEEAQVGARLAAGLGRLGAIVNPYD
ncbi:MAG TPA: sigma-E factor regulatory protein RseB domain-containing protein [Nocardioidaceae bacterium]|nr:sigma-E factor regulatory protein RseB domain-containing protein [Nocardioidaceae bacterium]